MFSATILKFPCSSASISTLAIRVAQAGIFRYMRSAPVLIDIVQDMERICPNARLLNYTNPMAMVCRTLAAQTNVEMVGLCHSVQGTAEMLARWIDKPMSEITYTCAGINHMAWYLKYEWNGQDAYPLIREAITSRPEIYNEEIVRNEMFLNLDYYVTESSGHNSEYNWWFRKRPELIEKYCTHGTGWNPGVHAYLVDRVLEQNQTWREDTQAWLNSPEPIKLDTRDGVCGLHHQRAARRRTIRILRQCSEYRPDHQSSGKMLASKYPFGRVKKASARCMSARCRRRSPFSIRSVRRSKKWRSKAA